MTKPTDKDILAAKKDAMVVASGILLKANRETDEGLAGQAVDTAISAAAMVVATAIEGRSAAVRRKAVDVIVDLFVQSVKALDGKIDGPEGLIHGMAAAVALEKIRAAAVEEELAS